MRTRADEGIGPYAKFARLGAGCKTGPGGWAGAGGGRLLHGFQQDSGFEQVAVYV